MGLSQRNMLSGVGSAWELVSYSDRTSPSSHSVHDEILVKGMKKHSWNKFDEMWSH